MAGIAEDYVSPSVRWGLLKQDYPDAVVEFDHGTGADISIPDKFGGDESYCIANIRLRPSDTTPIIGYKPFSDAQVRKNDHPSDAWNVLCTKALGRALKRAGYADTASELKVLVQYKQRLAEHEAIKVDSGGDELLKVPQITNTVQEPIADIPVPITEDEEIPATVIPLHDDDEWESETIRDQCHSELVSRIKALDEHYQEKVREVHQGINGRVWPVPSVNQFNFLVNAVEALHDQAFEEEDF